MNVAESQENQSRDKPPHNGIAGAIADYFQLDRYRTNFRTEISAGVATFMTMAYILLVGLGEINRNNWINFLAVLLVFLIVDRVIYWLNCLSFIKNFSG